ncbi:hypothetical protein [Peijinzhouia sedimentorum]
MIQEFVSSLWAKIKERLDIKEVTDNVSPFALVYLVAFAIYNWELIWTILYVGTTHQNFATQISLIQDELGNFTRSQRIFIPLWRALLYIIGYYLLSNIFLGLKILSNRYLKALVFIVFDPGTLIDKNLYKSALLRISSLNKILDNNQKDHEAEKKKISDDKEKLNDRIEELESDNLQQQVDYSKLSESFIELNKEKIVFASYGKGEHIKDVTKIVSGIYEEGETLLVNNKTFGNDPLLGVKKYLRIHLLKDKKIVQFIAAEHSKVDFKNRQVQIYPPQEEVNSQNERSDDLVKLIKIMNGRWTLKYSSLQLFEYEDIEIDRQGRYMLFRNKQHRFDLKNISIDFPIISLQKVLPDGNVFSIETLEVINNRTIVGSDDKKRTLEYTYIPSQE